MSDEPRDPDQPETPPDAADRGRDGEEAHAADEDSDNITPLEPATDRSSERPRSPGETAEVIPLRAVARDGDPGESDDVPPEPDGAGNGEDTGPDQSKNRQPPRTLLGAILRRVTDNLAGAARRGEQDNAVLQLLAMADDDESSGEVVDLTRERLRRRGPPPSEVDIGAALREQFEHYIDENVRADDASPDERRVRIDADFVREHGAKLLPSLFGHVAETITANMAGLAAPPPRSPADQDDDDDEATGTDSASKGAPGFGEDTSDDTDDDDTTDEAGGPHLHAVDPDADEAVHRARPKTRVEVDLLSVLAALIQPPDDADSDTTDTDLDDDDVSDDDTARTNEDSEPPKPTDSGDDT